MSMTYPLNPLSIEEIAEAVGILKQERSLADYHRFPMTRLEEPTKAEMKAHAAGQALPRLAFFIVLDARNGDSFEAVVDIGARRVNRWRPPTASLR
jgi:primary-amine oxidase